MRVCLDVGAAWGDFSRDVARKKFFDSFYLVEPNDYFNGDIMRIKKSKVINVAVVPKGLAGSPVILYKTANRELSSVLPPRDLSGEELWSSHSEGFRTNEVTLVESAELDDIIRRVRFETKFTSLLLKIDIQGLDFAVLSDSQLISEADIVVLEVPYNSGVSLSNSPTELSLRDVMTGLNKIGFQVLRVVPNGGGEANITLFSNRLNLMQALALEEVSGFSTSWVLKLGPKPLSAKWLTLIRNLRSKFLSPAIRLQSHPKDL